MPQNGQHFLVAELLKRASGRDIDSEVIKNLQGFTDKVITDILNRASLLARHKGTDVIDTAEIAMIMEKDFDFSFGTRILMPTRDLPSEEHMEKMAELSRQR